MSWVDVVMLVMLVGITLLETMRSQDGMGQGLLDAMAAIFTVWLTGRLYPRLVSAFGWSDFAAYLALLLPLLTVSLILAKLAQDSAQMSLDTFDPVLGFLCGFMTAWAICHAVLRLLVLSDPKGQGVVPLVDQSWLCHQLLFFELFHHADQGMRTLGHYD